MNNPKQNRKTTSDDYRYEIVHTEEMIPQDIESLAMLIATCVHEELQRVAIEAIKGYMPEFNPLNDPEHYRGETVQLDEATRNRYPYVVHCNINLNSIPGIEKSGGLYLLYRAPDLLDEPDDITGESE